MKESYEGVVRLKMLTELGMRDTLEFIHIGNIQISDANNARELIKMADYLDLPHLKTLAERFLVINLNASNAISTYYFAESYRCEQLISVSKNCIFANITTLNTTKEFLNPSIREVKIWIASDEINVNAEEDVFKIVLAWIDHEKSERRKYFAELFREV